MWLDLGAKSGIFFFYFLFFCRVRPGHGNASGGDRADCVPLKGTLQSSLMVEAGSLGFRGWALSRNLCPAGKAIPSTAAALA